MCYDYIKQILYTLILDSSTNTMYIVTYFCSTDTEIHDDDKGITIDYITNASLPG